MKKEYHYTISRTDRIYLVTFVLVLLSWELFKVLLPQEAAHYDYIPKDEPSKEKTYHADTGKKNKREYKPYPKRQYKRWNDQYKNEEDENFVNPPPTGPMLLSEAGVEDLLGMGFSRKAAYNIDRYQKAGGTIADTMALMKIYGMDSTQLEKTLPYIIFPQRSFASITLFSTGPPVTNRVIDLNKATIEELDQLPGIGPVLAERIIKYRRSLGGFIDADQLKDCYGLPPETFEKIRARVSASGEPVKININQTDLRTVSHPYLPKKVAHVIEAYKKQHGVIADAEELRKVYPGDTVWYEKISTYLEY